MECAPQILQSKIMDTKKLRQKILDLAIHGKLVPQDPNDEPASVLLEQIKAEKERLIKEGKLKRSKNLVSSDTLHYQKDVPFEVPKGWEWCKFQDCMDVRDGTHDSPKYIQEGYPLITSKDFKNGQFDLSKTKYISEEDYQNIIKRSRVDIGDILYSMIGGNIGSMIRIYPDNYFDMAIKNVALFKPYQNGNISTEYIAFFLESKIKEYQTIAIGGAQPFVGLDIFRNTLVPLPPIEEQHRIVIELKHWQSLIDNIEHEIEDLQFAIKHTKNKILNLAIHGKLVLQDPNDEPAIELLKRINPNVEITTDNMHYPQLPEEWCTTALGNIFNHNTGKALNSSNKEGIMREYLTTSNVYWNRFDLSIVKQMPFKKNEIDKYTVTKGDLLVCEGGDVGRSAIWSFDYDICIQNHLHRLRPKGDIIVSFYYYILMLLKENNLIDGKGIGLLGLSSSELHKIVVPVPPYAEQQCIVKTIEYFFKQIDIIMENL